jgi:hypothetical protein
MSDTLKQMVIPTFIFLILGVTFFMGMHTQKQQDKAIMQILLAEIDTWEREAIRSRKESDTIFAEYMLLMLSDKNNNKELNPWR